MVLPIPLGPEKDQILIILHPFKDKKFLDLLAIDRVLSASLRAFVLKIPFGAMNDGLRINGDLDATEGRPEEPDSPEVGPTHEIAQTPCW